MAHFAYNDGWDFIIFNILLFSREKFFVVDRRQNFIVNPVNLEKWVIVSLIWTIRLRKSRNFTRTVVRKGSVCEELRKLL